MCAPALLVVDDDFASRQGLARLLELDGYQVDQADSAARALASAERQRPAVVVTDLHMPGMDGLELIRRLRALDPRVQVVLATAAASPEVEREALRAGARGCLPKPLDVDVLLDWIPQLARAAL